MKSLLTTLVLIFVSNSFASIYKCSSPESIPTKTNESIKSELLISNMPPYITSNEVNVENLDPKAPFLIYYAIDTAEDFMQFSVKYEIAQLQKSCKKNSNVQFIAFLNSLFVSENSFLICKNKELKQEKFTKYPHLNHKLSVKRFLISGKSRIKQDNVSLIFKNNSSDSNLMLAFYNYPLAHPDFLFELIKFTTTHKNIFPNNKYSPFLNLKSHGSNKHILAGLHKCQKDAKVLSSQKIIQRLLSKAEYEFAISMDSSHKVEKNIDAFEKVISKLDLGLLHGIGSLEKDPKLGEDNLSIDPISTASGLGNGFSGLGVHEGLGASFSFGTDQDQLSKILNQLYKSGSNRSLGFLMLESCDSSRNPSIYHSNLTNIYGYYTSKMSLWYRNLNWWKMLEKANGRTVDLVNILQEETSRIPNIEVINK